MDRKTLLLLLVFASGIVLGSLFSFSEGYHIGYETPIDSTVCPG